jgi:transposase
MDSTGCMSNQGFLTAPERKELLALVRAQSGSHGVARRANAILLLDKGWSFEAVAEALFINDSSVRAWRTAFTIGGVEALSKFDWRGGSSHLSVDQQAQLSDLSTNACAAARLKSSLGPGFNLISSMAAPA